MFGEVLDNSLVSCFFETQCIMPLRRKQARHLQLFLPRDAALGRYTMSVGLCPSVSLQVGVLSKLLDESSRFLARELV